MYALNLGADNEIQAYVTGYIHIYNASVSEIDRLIFQAQAFYGVDFDFVGMRDDGQTAVFASNSPGQDYILFYYI